MGYYLEEKILLAGGACTQVLHAVEDRPLTTRPQHDGAGKRREDFEKFP